MNISDMLCSIKEKSRAVNKIYYILPAIFSVIAVLVIVFSGGNVLVVKAIENKGLFPSAFFYYIGYFIRIILSSVWAAAVIEKFFVEKECFVYSLFVILVPVLLLFEYKLIFCLVRIMFSLLLGIIILFLCVLGAVTVRIYKKSVVVCVLLLCLMQFIFIIQTVSLVACL